MVSTTSGTTGFLMEVDDIIRHALAPVGGEHSSGIDMEDARLALNLLLIALQNKNIPLHKLDTVPLTLLEDIDSYTLPINVNDVLSATIIQSANPDTEIVLERYGVREFNAIPVKNLSQRPNLFVLERKRDQAILKVWPVPNDGTYTMKLFVSKKIEDITAAYQKLDIPYRYFPLVVKWLGYELSILRPGTPEEVRNRLKMEYMELLPDTFDEDRERVDTTITPGGISGR